MRNIGLALVFILALTACKQQEENNDEIIARTSTQVLMKSEVLDGMPISLSQEDSITFVKSYVENWLRTTVLYEKAIDNVRDRDSVLAKQVDLFRKELFINTYEQLFLQQKLDTLIPQKEIDAYYAEHKNEYLLERPVVKAILIVFPLQKKTEIANVEKIIFARKGYDIDDLKDYCFRYCQKFSFSDQWVDIAAVRQELPFDVRSEKLNVGKYEKFVDTANVYYLKITEQISAGNPMPVQFAHDKIAKILLQSRKVELLKNMRNKVYQDALHKNQFEVFY
ncbi:MAG: hypothetical protein IK117_10860 [Bacteroidales bacterium]|nr:hypothetical protein [Bacteroidales bacterium]